MPSSPWAPLDDRVERQATFLRNPLPPQPGVCEICRRDVGPGYSRCFKCSEHRRASDLTADVVVPISYAIKGGQHAHNLWIYKSDQPSPKSRAELLAVGATFLRDHIRCVQDAIGGITHVVMVPSTKNRQGVHPLEDLIGPVLAKVPRAPVRVDVPYSDRNFHRDWFASGDVPGAKVLILDDTWTSGARVQSLSHSLKSAGADRVAAVVLGRHMDPGWAETAALIERLRGSNFDPSRCALDDLP